MQAEADDPVRDDDDRQRRQGRDDEDGADRAEHDHDGGGRPGDERPDHAPRRRRAVDRRTGLRSQVRLRPGRRPR